MDRVNERMEAEIQTTDPLNLEKDFIDRLELPIGSSVIFIMLLFCGFCSSGM